MVIFLNIWYSTLRSFFNTYDLACGGWPWVLHLLLVLVSTTNALEHGAFGILISSQLFLLKNLRFLWGLERLILHVDLCLPILVLISLNISAIKCSHFGEGKTKLCKFGATCTIRRKFVWAKSVHVEMYL